MDAIYKRKMSMVQHLCFGATILISLGYATQSNANICSIAEQNKCSNYSKDGMTECTKHVVIVGSFQPGQKYDVVRCDYNGDTCVNGSDSTTCNPDAVKKQSKRGEAVQKKLNQDQRPIKVYQDQRQLNTRSGVLKHQE